MFWEFEGAAAARLNDGGGVGWWGLNTRCCTRAGILYFFFLKLKSILFLYRSFLLTEREGLRVFRLGLVDFLVAPDYIAHEPLVEFFMV